MYRQWLENDIIPPGVLSYDNAFFFHLRNLTLSDKNMLLFYGHFCKLLRYKLLPYVPEAYEFTWPDYAGFDYFQILSAAETSSSEAYTVTTSSSSIHAQERALMQFVSRIRPPPQPRPAAAADGTQDDPPAISGIKMVQCGKEQVMVWPSGPKEAVCIREDLALMSELEECWMTDMRKSLLLFILVATKIVLRHVQLFFCRYRRVRLRHVMRGLRRHRQLVQHIRQATLQRALQGDVGAAVAVMNEPELYAVFVPKAASSDSKDTATLSAECEDDNVVASLLYMIEEQMVEDLNKAYLAYAHHFANLAEKVIRFAPPTQKELLFYTLRDATLHLHNVVTYSAAPLSLQREYWATRDAQCEQFYLGWAGEAGGDLNRYLQLGEPTAEDATDRASDAPWPETERYMSMAALATAREQPTLRYLQQHLSQLRVSDEAVAPVTQRAVSERTAGPGSRPTSSSVASATSRTPSVVSLPRPPPLATMSEKERAYDEAQWHRLQAIVNACHSSAERRMECAIEARGRSCVFPRVAVMDPAPVPLFFSAKVCARVVRDFRTCPDPPHSLLAWIAIRYAGFSFGDLLPQETPYGVQPPDVRHRRLAPHYAPDEAIGLLRMLRNSGVLRGSSRRSRRSRRPRSASASPTSRSASGGSSGSNSSGNSATSSGSNSSGNSATSSGSNNSGNSATSSGSNNSGNNAAEPPSSSSASSLASSSSSSLALTEAIAVAMADGTWPYNFGLDSLTAFTARHSPTASTALVNGPVSSVAICAERDAPRMETTELTILSPTGGVLRLELCNPLPLSVNAAKRYQCDMCYVTGISVSFQAVIYDNVRHRISIFQQSDGFDVCLVCAAYLFHEATRRLLTALHPDPRQRRPFEHGTFSHLRIWSLKVSAVTSLTAASFLRVRLCVGVSPECLRVAAWHVPHAALDSLSAELNSTDTENSTESMGKGKEDTAGDEDVKDNEENEGSKGSTSSKEAKAKKGRRHRKRSKVERVASLLPVPPPYWSAMCIVTHTPLARSAATAPRATPVHKFEEGDECAICLQPLLGPTPTTETVCHHWFHTTCLMDLHSFHDKTEADDVCPVCRTVDYYPIAQTPEQVVRQNTYSLDLSIARRPPPPPPLGGLAKPMGQRPAPDGEPESRRREQSPLDNAASKVVDDAEEDDESGEWYYIAVCSLMNEQGQYQNPTNVAACHMLKIRPSMLYAEEEEQASSY